MVKEPPLQFSRESTGLATFHGFRDKHRKAALGMTTFSRNTLSRMTFLTGARLLAAGLGFVVVVLIARHYGAGALGQLWLALSLRMQAIVVTKFGTDQIGVRQIASGNDSAASVAGTVIFLRFATACVAWMCPESRGNRRAA